MAHRRGGSFRGRGISQSQRRKKTWVQIKQLVDGTQVPGFVTNFALEITQSVTPGVGVTEGFIGVSGDGTGAAPLISVLPDECTILRVRGSLDYPKSLATDGGAAGDVDCGFGFGVTGISDLDSNSYPGPISEADWDGWMFKRSAPITPVDGVGSMVDVKAMRKVKSGDSFFIMAEVVSGIGASQVGTFQWQFDFRLLLLLP